MTTKTRPIGALGDSLIDDMAKSLSGLSVTMRSKKNLETVRMDNMGGKVDGPDFQQEGDPSEEARLAIANVNDEDDASLIGDTSSIEDDLENKLDTVNDNSTDGTTPTDLPNEIQDKYTELTAEQVSDNETETDDLLDKVANIEPDESKKGSKLNKENRETLAQIQALLQKLSGDEDTTEEKTSKTLTVKGISVADNLYDMPVQNEFYNIFDAFVSACYKLAIAADINEQPMTAEYMALINELANLLKKAVLEENAEDTADGDGTVDDFVGESDKSVSLAMIQKKAESYINRIDVKQNELVDTLKAQLETKTKELEELETTTNMVKTTVTQLETKFAEFEERIGKVSDLDSKIEEKAKEYEKITKMKLPRPDESKADVVINELLGTNKARKSYVGMSNADFLTLDRIDK